MFWTTLYMWRYLYGMHSYLKYRFEFWYRSHGYPTLYYIQKIILTTRLNYWKKNSKYKKMQGVGRIFESYVNPQITHRKSVEKFQDSGICLVNFLTYSLIRQTFQIFTYLHITIWQFIWGEWPYDRIAYIIGIIIIGN